jgi:hypothetical protein
MVLFDILIGVLTLVVLPILINKSTEQHFSWVKNWLRELWCAVALIYSYYGATRLGWIMRAHGTLGVAYPRGSYVIVGLIGVFVACGFWWVAGQVFPSAVVSERKLQAPRTGTPTDESRLPEGESSAKHAAKDLVPRPMVVPHMRTDQELKEDSAQSARSLLEDVRRLADARKQEEDQLPPVDPSMPQDKTNKPWILKNSVESRTAQIFQSGRYAQRCRNLIQMLERFPNDERLAADAKDLKYWGQAPRTVRELNTLAEHLNRTFLDLSRPPTQLAQH